MKTIAPGWLVVQVLGTLFIAATLITARESTPWVWACYGVSAACWLGFLVTGRVFLLVIATVVPALALGAAQDSSAILLSVITLGRLATTVRLSEKAILAVAGVDVALALVLERSLVDAGVLLLVLLLGLNRRSYEVLAEQSARAAALDERTRIAREIHDVLAHSLGALTVQLELAEALLTERSDVDGARRTIQRSRGLAIEGLAEARNAVAALRQDVPSLTEALRSLADVTVTGTERPLPSKAKVALLGVAREALTNAAKHAPGAAVDVRLEFHSGGTRLHISNDASGDQGEGFGLVGMRERIALAGGTLTAGMNGSKWHVTAEVPA
ncbi:two-component sensor histidine kinase [Lentzea sp. NBRC 105346]|uniref:sensor histidine kinase n=1 Tax=Lentzea sp. NBRC 105346 TaxID=3032205 RepID=UPI0024A28D89|nr:histidine kinase [Lentzea sp. NBRC 105346]GLZ33163.1 two-component sensor histidine kinase [Lentzea sp. NBRC 105346]